LPLAIDANGVKLSKSTGAAAVDAHEPTRELWRTLHFLKQGPPPGLRRGPVAPLWEWAIEHWQTRPLAGLRQMELV
jgi:glutamyl-Q tRNA(Asp) synthetase